MGARTIEEAIRIIEECDLSPYVEKAVWLGHFGQDDTELAMMEYRQFRLLEWISQNVQGSCEPLVPTSRAESICSSHFIHGANYKGFVNALLGYTGSQRCILGLSKSAPEFHRAVEYTQSIHETYGVAQGFCREYPLACDVPA